ncbi:MAG: glycosyl transferase family 2 [Marinilabiliales bacterium]|nr:MAG: glycosyl transferase family 2 [Marinilabiliales bacterium]
MDKNLNVVLSVVSPMFNEEENVETTVGAIQSELNKLNINWELILVNDGSTDQTKIKAKKLEEENSFLKIVSYDINRGRGHALRKGFDAAKGKYIISIDFDLSYSPDHITKIFNELQNNPRADIVMGSAYMKGGKTINVPPKRLFMSKLGNKILRIAFRGEFKTITCILRGYRKDVLNALSLDSEDKEIHLEILSKSLALGYKVVEIPATLTGRKKGTTKSKLKRISISHLLFSIFEKPVVIFSVLGSILLTAGIGFGLYISYLRFISQLNAGRPLFYLVVILILVGFQLLSFAIISGQNSMLRNEIYKLQSKLKKIEKKSENSDQE